MQDDNPIADEIHDFTKVDRKTKLAGIMQLLTAYAPADMERMQALVKAEEGVDKDEFIMSYPGLVANTLVDDLATVALGQSNIAEFMVNAVIAMGSLAQAISAFTSFTNPTQLHSLVKSWEDYSAAAPGSVAEVHARTAYESIMEDINATILRKNPKLFAAFEDSEYGFFAVALLTLNGDMDEDEDEDDENEDVFVSIEPATINNKKVLN